MTNRALVLVSLVAVACGSPGDLTPDAVRTIPDGDASGAAWSGAYEIEIRTVECSGTCGPFTVGIFSASVCDVGDVDTERVEVVQTEGHLQIDTSDLPSRFEGGVFANGSFDVGGYATQFGGELEISARGEGTIDPSGRIEATIRSRTWGQVEGQGADCLGVREVTGVRE